MYIKNSDSFKLYKLSLNRIFLICEKEIGNIGNESIEEGASVEGVKTKHLSTSVEDISIGSGVATHIESSGVDILAQHSKVVEQDDKMNEGKARIMPSQEIQVEEGLNLLDKQEGTYCF